MKSGRKSKPVIFYLLRKGPASQLAGRVPQCTCRWDLRTSPISASNAEEQVEMVTDILVPGHTLLLSVSHHLLEVKVYSSNWSNFQPGLILPTPPQRAFDNVCRQFLLSQLGVGSEQCSWLLVNKGPDAASHITTQKTVPITKNYLVQNIKSQS